MGADPDYTFVVDNVPEGCPIDVVNHSLRSNPIFNAFEYVAQEPSDEKGFIRVLYWVPAEPSSDTWPSKVYPMGVSAEGCPCRYQSLPKSAQPMSSPSPLSLLNFTSECEDPMIDESYYSSSLWEENKGCSIKDSEYAEIKMNLFVWPWEQNHCPTTPPPSPPPIPPRVGKVAVKEFCVAQPPERTPYPAWVKKGNA
ncbi:hypothetical protein XELAEV_18031491mg [Xenopus laevis]|uniref:Uncharacterized protein n=1 Tax=Xenopus laevis TaxID=8355 RepID=A0A974HFP1_XENLA|nr:hypothetical protein XELAEV_18031491mg [Xenopus laevis]